MKLFRPLFKRSVPKRKEVDLSPKKAPKAPGEQGGVPPSGPPPSSSPDAGDFSEGIGENWLNHLHGLIPVRKLQAGDILIMEGEVEEEVYIILEGSFRVEKEFFGKVEDIATLGKGAMIGEIAFTMKRPRTASVIAATPSKVMCISQGIFEDLGERIQLFLLKQMNLYASARISALQAREEELASRNHQLTDHLYTSHVGASTDYLDSRMIRNIIAKIPRLPVFAATMASKMLSDQVTAGDVADMIKKDPAIAGVILKSVNSSFYGFRQKISDIHHAVLLIGITGIYQLVVAEGIRRTMPNTPVFNELYLHSQSISHIAYQISRDTKVGKAPQMATIGLMHDLGHIVTELLKQQNPKVASLIEFIDNTKVGAILLADWNLPEVVWKTISFQSYPEFSQADNIPADIRNNVAILHIAHRCYEMLQEKPAGKTPETFMGDYKGLLNWGDLSMTDILRKHLLPAMHQNIKSYPLPLQELITRNI